MEQVETSTIVQSDDDTMPADGALAKWAGFYDEIGEKLGVDFRAAESAYQAMKDAGLTNVTERIVKVPIGPWAKDKNLKAWGGWFGYFVLEALEGFVLRAFTDVLGVGYPPFSFLRPYSSYVEDFILTLYRYVRTVVLRRSASLHCSDT